MAEGAGGCGDPTDQAGAASGHVGSGALSLRAHFVNENLGGHATMHRALRVALPDHPDVRPSFFDVPAPGSVHRMLRAEIPGLARLDLDLAPLRDQLSRARAVQRHLRSLSDDVEVLHLYTHNAALLSTAVMGRVPTVVSLDATNRDNAHRLPGRLPTRFTPLAARPVMALERRVYERAHAIVTHSAWAADSVATYGIDRSSIHVIPFGIPIGPVPADRRDDGLPRILFVGTTMARKGGWRLVDIWRRHLADRSRLVLVTKDPVAPEPGLEVRDDIRPGDGQLDQLLGTVDVFAMPGEIDAFGYALLEAMAGGVPVVAARQAAVPEIVTHGESGLLVPPGDDAAFAAALATLVADAGLRTELGAAGRQRVCGHFDAARTTADLIEVLRSVT